MLMYPLKARLKLLTRIAQQGVQPATPAATPVLPPPPGFSPMDVWGWLGRAYNSSSINTINSLFSILNTSLHYASNGQVNMQVLRDNGFNIDPSGMSSMDAKNLLNLSILAYKTILNSGNAMPTVSPDKIQIWCKQISNSQALMNLSQVNPTGQLAQKVPGNIKDNILNLLRYLEAANPVQQR
jgi:hypothetical protein